MTDIQEQYNALINALDNAENTEACVKQLCAAALAAGTYDDRSATIMEYV